MIVKTGDGDIMAPWLITSWVQLGGQLSDTARKEKEEEEDKVWQ